MNENLKRALDLIEWIEKYSFDFGAQTRAHHAKGFIDAFLLETNDKEDLQAEYDLDHKDA